MVHVQAFVALKSNEIGVEKSCDDLRHFCFTHAGLAFQKQRSTQLEGQVNRRR
jgi:hypothetical protein